MIFLRLYEPSLLLYFIFDLLSISELLLMTFFLMTVDKVKELFSSLATSVSLRRCICFLPGLSPCLGLFYPRISPTSSFLRSCVLPLNFSRKLISAKMKVFMKQNKNKKPTEFIISIKT